jgi:hypothetical protein
MDGVVIPGKLAIASATRNPGISLEAHGNRPFWIPVFIGMTIGGGLNIDFLRHIEAGAFFF